MRKVLIVLYKLTNINVSPCRRPVQICLNVPIFSPQLTIDHCVGIFDKAADHLRKTDPVVRKTPMFPSSFDGGNTAGESRSFLESVEPCGKNETFVSHVQLLTKASVLLARAYCRMGLV